MTSGPLIRPLAGVRDVGYLRVSTAQQAGDDQVSIDDQRRSIEAKAATIGRSVEVWFTDPGASGGSFELRADMASLIASAEASPRPRNDMGNIWVMTASRFGRPDDPEESAYWRHRFTRCGWQVRYTVGDDSDDLTTRTLMRAIGDVGATKERQEIRRRSRMGSRGATEKGFWKGGPSPFGYVRKVCRPEGREQRILSDGVRKGSDEKVMLWPDEKTAAFLRSLFERYAQGDIGLEGIAALGMAAYPTRFWDSGSVYYLFRNRVYLGHLEGDGFGMANAHPAIVSQALFDAVADQLNRNRHQRTGKGWPFIASGMVVCSDCGLPLIGGGSSGQGKPYYRCRGAKVHGSPCFAHGTNVMAVRLEYAIRSALADRLSSPEIRRATIHEIDAALDRAATVANPSTAPQDATIASTAARIQRLVQAVAGGVLTDTEASNQLAALRAEQAAAERSRAEVRRFTAHAAAHAVDRPALYRMVDTMPEMMYRLAGTDAKRMMALWLHSATFNRVSRILTLGIRRLPLVVGLGITGSAPADHEEAHLLFVTQRIDLGRQVRLGGAR